MTRLDDMILATKIRGEKALDRFFHEENGDTNLISMLILIAVAVFLASAFKTVGKNILELVGQKVTTFINSTAN